MGSKKIFCSFKPNGIGLMQINFSITKVFVLTLSLFSFLLILDSYQSFNKVNAVDSLTKSILKFNNQIQSDVDNQVQSNLNQGRQQPSTNDNMIDCIGNDNLINQLHSSSNGQTPTSINNPSCNGPTTTIQSPFD